MALKQMQSEQRRMHDTADDAISVLSSSSISSPPVSPQNISSLADTIRVAHSPSFSPSQGLHPQPVKPQVNTAARVANQPPSSRPSHNTKVMSAGTTPGPPSGAVATEKPKRQRRKNNAAENGKPDASKITTDEKPKKVRKPRESKDKSNENSTAQVPAPPSVPTFVSTAETNTAAAPRKRQKTEPAVKDVAVPPTSTSRQPSITDMIASIGAAFPSKSTKPAASPGPSGPLSTSIPESALKPPPLPASTPKPPLPSSRGQNYDPIRGFDPVRAATMETSQARLGGGTTPTPVVQAAIHVNRASASPSIASLIDPPIVTTPSHAYSPHPPIPRPATVPALSSPPPPPIPKPSPISSLISPQPQSESIVSQLAAPAPKSETAMDLDEPKKPAEVVKSTSGPSGAEVKSLSKSVSPAITPKIARTADMPAPKGTGSGLLSSSDLFGGPSTNGDASERKGVNIDIQITLNPNGGNTINMAQEIAKKYGRDAINPRAAAHRERLLAVAAAANKIEGLNGDDMSIDGTSDVDIESNVEMGGMDDDKSITGAESGTKPIKRRRRKLEEYDKEDDFIDDTELAWQEQAAVAKDGFFVYSGPLVPVGQDAQIESSAPNRGRARGRGRGAKSGAAGAPTTQSSVPEKGKDANAALTSARGRGGRARTTTTVRKPRVSKADREAGKTEKEPAARTNVPASAVPATATTSTYVPPVMQPSATTTTA